MHRPRSNSHVMMECSGHQLTFQFQVGLIRDKVTVATNDLNLKSVKSLAADFVGEKFPTNGITRLQERILLFRHDYNSTNVLQVRTIRIQCTYLLLRATRTFDRLGYNECTSPSGVDARKQGLPYIDDALNSCTDAPTKLHL